VTALSSVLERPVFSVGSRQFRWADVIGEADWELLRRKAAQGVAAAAAAEIADADLQQESARFRYERNLVAGEEMEAWLARWELSVAEWRDYLRRAMARERAQSFEPADADDRLVWIEAVCSGALEKLAVDTAARAAAAEALQEDDLHRAYERFLADAVDHGILESLLDTRKADWLRVDCRTLVFDTGAAAREAALCVRDDGMALSEVAAQAGVEIREHSLHLEDAQGELGNALLSARTGELLGPIPLADRFALVLVDDKVEPSLEDPEILRRVQEAARRRAIEREVVNRVTWHERI
jgi:hypothetical protein